MLELPISLRYLFSKQKEGFLRVLNIFSFIGIMLGVMTLIIVMSVMKGYEIELIDKILNFRSHLTVMSDKGIKNYSIISNKIAKIPHVINVLPVLEGQVMIASGDKMRGLYIRGVDFCQMRQSILSKIFNFHDEPMLKAGASDICNLKKGALLGASLIRDLQYPHSAKFLAPNTSSTILGDIPRIKTLEIVGYFDLQMHEYNSNIAFIDINSAQLLFDRKNAISYIEVTVDEIENIFTVTQQLKEHFPNYTILDWRKTNSSLSAALEIERNLMFIILSLIIIIATFNIISSLVILVYVKKTDIAIMRTIGATRGMIARIFIFAGCIIGFTATLFGGIFGILFCKYINEIKEALQNICNISLMDPAVYHLLSLPTSISYMDCAVVMIMAFGFSMLATIYPSMKIAMMSPSKILREMT